VDAHQIRGLVDVFAACRAQMEETRRAFAAYGALFEAHLLRTYEAEVGRAPGSDRTKRLRKKRRTALWRWWEAQITEGVT
jgi:hypothetical protein